MSTEHPEEEEAATRAQTAAVSVITEAMGYTYAAALRAAALIGVADHFGDGPRTPAELASATGVNAGHLNRLLRLLATRDIFREDDQGRFTLTPMADALRSDAPSSARGAVIMSTMQTHWYSAFDLSTSVRHGAPACDQVFGMPFFDYLAHDPAAGAEFHGGMDSFSDAARKLAVNSYDFPDTGSVVDVGGGHGGLLKDILIRYPGLTGVLFDRDHVLAGHCLTDLGADHRWRLDAGDFFEAVPPGGDIYTLTYILHDWSDDDAARILQNCRRAMSPNGRVLAFDTVIPPGNEPGHAKVLDIVMAFLLTGRERTADEFATLFSRAGLTLTRITPTPGPLSIIEGQPT